MSPDNLSHRIASLHADLLYLRTLLLGLVPLLLLQLLCGLQVYVLLLLLPAPNQRPLRLAIGLSTALLAAAAAAHIFDPERCLSGAISAGTLLAFHAPLRVLALLASPPPPSPPSSLRPAKPNLRRILALVAVPASAIITDPPTPTPPPPPPIAEHHHHHHSPASSISSSATSYHTSRANAGTPSSSPLHPPVRLQPPLAAVATPVPPIPALRAASLAFSAAAFSAYAIPPHYARSSLYLLPLITTITYGFVNISSAVGALLGRFPISSPFSWPWLSPSLASFWAYRWNAPIAAALRAGVYEPLVLYAAVPRAVAILACFIASGLGHVAILYYVRESPGMPLWFVFFAVHGLAVCLERVAWDRKLLNRPLHRRLFVTVFMLATAELWFVPALRDSHFFDEALHELGTAFRMVENIAYLGFGALVARVGGRY